MLNSVVILPGRRLSVRRYVRQIIEGDARQQTERAFQNIATILEASGSNVKKVVQCGVFLKSMGDFEAHNAFFVDFRTCRLPMTSVYAAILSP